EDDREVDECVTVAGEHPGDVPRLRRPVLIIRCTRSRWPDVLDAELDDLTATPTQHRRRPRAANPPGTAHRRPRRGPGPDQPLPPHQTVDHHHYLIWAGQFSSERSQARSSVRS